MSLKAFHLLFIALSVMLAAFFAAWAIGQYRLDPRAAYLATAALSLLCAGGLAIYGAAFQRRTKRWS
jgi:hypothetical protein